MLDITRSCFASLYLYSSYNSTLEPVATLSLPALAQHDVLTSRTTRHRAKQRPPEYTTPVTCFPPLAFNIPTSGPDMAAERICYTCWYVYVTRANTRESNG